MERSESIMQPRKGKEVCNLLIEGKGTGAQAAKIAGVGMRERQRWRGDGQREKRGPKGRARRDGLMELTCKEDIPPHREASVLAQTQLRALLLPRVRSKLMAF